MKELQQQFPGLVPLLTRKDVARLAGVTTHTIKRDVKRGLLKEIVQNARRRRYHPKVVEEYLTANYPATAYTRRRLSSVRSTKSNPDGNLDKVNSNDSSTAASVKTPESRPKIENSPENSGETGQNRGPGSIIKFLQQSAISALFRPLLEGPARN